jgi:hypothetical protein
MLNLTIGSAMHFAFEIRNLDRRKNVQIIEKTRLKVGFPKKFCKKHLMASRLMKPCHYKYASLG